MEVIKPNEELTRKLKIIPRIKWESVFNVRIINELNEETTVLEDVSCVFKDGFIEFDVNYIFNKHDSKYSIDLFKGEVYISRFKLWVTNDEDLQNLDNELIYV